MIAKLFQTFTFLNDEIRSLHKAAYVLSAFAFVSILLALLRDRLFAHVFGVGDTLDVYYAAFRIPDLVFITLGSLVSVFVVIPALTRAKHEHTDHALARTLLLATGVLFLGTSIALFFAVPFMLPYVFPEIFGRGLGSELVLLTRILLLQPFFLGISNLAASCVQMYGRYALFALAPVLYNIGIIAGVLFFYQLFGIAGLGVGVVFGAMLHFFVQAPFFFAHGLSGKLSFVPLREIYAIALQSIPRTLSLTFGALAVLALTSYASTLHAGAVTLFMFAFNLSAAPLSLIGASYSVAAFPTLSALYQKNQYAEFKEHILIAGRHILFWSLPIISLCVVLRAHIVRAILGTGAFSWSDTRIAAATFALFVLSLAAQGIMLLFVRGYYATERTIVPLVVTACTAVGSVVFGMLLASLYEREGIMYYFIQDLLRLSTTDDASVALLALGMSIAYTIGAIALVLIFSRTFSGVSRELGKAFRDGFVGAVFAGTGAYAVLTLFRHVYSLDSFLQIVFQGSVATLAGLCTAGAVLFLIGNREVREIWLTFRGRFVRVRIRGAEEVL